MNLKVYKREHTRKSDGGKFYTYFTKMLIQEGEYNNGVLELTEPKEHFLQVKFTRECGTPRIMKKGELVILDDKDVYIPKYFSDYTDSEGRHYPTIWVRNYKEYIEHDDNKPKEVDTKTLNNELDNAGLPTDDQLPF